MFAPLLQNLRDRRPLVHAITNYPEIPRNAFAKIVANYYHYCFDGKNEEADQIIEFMKSNGMSHLIKNFIVENCHL